MKEVLDTVQQYEDASRPIETEIINIRVATYMYVHFQGIINVKLKLDQDKHFNSGPCIILA